MRFATILSGFVLLQGAVASPISDSAGVETRDVEPRAPGPGDFPWPRLPALRRATTSSAAKGSGKDCPSAPPTTSQGNACSSGTQFCCTTNSDGTQSCANSEVCNAKIICCNNNNGFQMCIGEVDFNAPVTININVFKGGKGGKGSHY
ncbi:related to hydrophobin [Fusarium torulosum]|uniref:Related to hydrophobin n=1 Tax=Fusarium torulosum TaxID=33205 RepID=A0AAE8SHK4_9HYPO|nr:related to hydrophobin [Fusarium torulosum]